MLVRTLGQEDPLQKEMATYSSIHAWRISWTEEPGRLWGCKELDMTEVNEHTCTYIIVVVSVVQLLSCAQLFAITWTAACQASLSFTISQNLLKFMSIELMLFNHPILCHPLLLLPLIFPSIGIFSNELTPCMRWPK